MKTKKHESTPARPFHLNLEYFFRKRYCALVIMLLLGVAIFKSDGRFLGIMRDAYNHGYGMIGSYMREETTRMPITVLVARTPTISGK